MTYLGWNLNDSKFIFDGESVGLGNRFWFRIRKYTSWFRKPYYTVELITVHENKFFNFDEAVKAAKKYIADFYDLLPRKDSI